VHKGDVVVVAGDVSSKMEVIECTLKLFADRFDKVVFTAGNHDLWVGGRGDPARQSSFAKLDEINAMCKRIGVATEPVLATAEGTIDCPDAYSAAWTPPEAASTSPTSPTSPMSTTSPTALPGVWVVPLLSWYDRSLDLTRINGELGPYAEGMEQFSWSDFALCNWPSAMMEAATTLTGMYPTGVASALGKRNDAVIEQVNHALRARRGDALLSFSHFLPRPETLPDWVRPDDSAFDPDWLNHPARATAVKFSAVAGSTIIEQQLRALTANLPRGGAYPLPHVHAFGHSHRPKDFELQAA